MKAMIQLIKDMSTHLEGLKGAEALPGGYWEKETDKLLKRAEAYRIKTEPMDDCKPFVKGE